jgi:phosphohistidine phosphatase
MKNIQICFFRHGIAVDPADPTMASDPAGHSRPLTEEGILKTRAAAEGLKRMDLGFEKVLTSPWLRANQTAVIVAEVLGLNQPEELPELAGDRTPADLVDALGQTPARRLVLVGHEPLLSSTVTYVLSADFPLELKKSGACMIQMDSLPPRRSAALLWLLTPKQLRWIGKS